MKRRRDRVAATAVILTLALGLLMPAASGCAARLTAARQLQRSNQPSALENPPGFKMTTGQMAYATSDDQVTLTLSNDTNQDMQFGAAYTLETMRDGVWYMVPYKGVKAGTEMTWPAIAYHLPAHGTALNAIRLSSLEGVDAGTYRLIKEIHPSDGYGKPFPVVAQFAIKAATTSNATSSPTGSQSSPTGSQSTPTVSHSGPTTSQSTPAASQAASVVPPACDRLWDLDPGQHGFGRTNAYRHAQFTCGEITLNLFAKPKAFDSFNPDTWERIGQGGSNAIQFWKRTTPEGVPYYLLRTATSWDATGAPGETGWRSGTTHSQALHLDQGGLGLDLSGDSGKANGSLDIVSLDTLRRLMAAPAGTAPDLPGCRANGEYWVTEFKNGHISLSIMVRPPPFDTDAYEIWAKTDGVSRKDTGDFEYFIRERTLDPDSPNHAAIACRTAVGLIEVRAGVPYQLRDQVPRERLDFMTIEYVRDLAARIGLPG